MARAIRWQVPFKSKNETSCLISIYDEGWEGDITTLTGAADPFIFQEDDTDSMVEVVRAKTAYLRVIEENYGDLDDMVPSDNTKHFVTAQYGAQIVYSGFMQAQTSSTQLLPGPRVREFPITSPLGISKGLRMPTPATPQFYTIASVLKMVADTMDADIDYVIFPDYMMSGSLILSRQFHSLNFCPYNEDYNSNRYDHEPLYAPITLEEMVEAICNCFGLVAHDQPNTLVFARYDYDGTYNRYVVSTMDEETPTYIQLTSGATTQDFSALPMRSNRGEEKNILPVRKIDINYEDEMFPDYEVAFNRAKSVGEQPGVVILNPSTNEITSDYLQTSAAPIAGNNKMTMCAIGKPGYFDSLTDMFVFSFETTTPTTTPILKWRIYNPPKYFGYGCELSFKVMTLDNNTYESHEVQNTDVGVILKNGNYYRQDDGTWVYTSAQHITTLTTDDSGMAKLQLLQVLPDWTSPLEVIFCLGQLGGNTLNAFTDIKIGRTVYSYLTYTGQVLQDKYTIDEENGSFEEGSVGQKLTVARPSEGCIIADTGSPSYGVIICDYDYLFETQNRITIDTYIAPSLLTTLYLKKTLMGNAFNKRIVAFSFDLWNDVMTISAQGSSTI